MSNEKKQLVNDYTIYCTAEQTKKALELGAPLYVKTGKSKSELQDIRTVANGMRKNAYTLLDNFQQSGDYWCKLITNPTAEQMIGYLRSKGFKFKLDDETGFWSVSIDDEPWAVGFGVDKNKEFAAINTALDYLIKKVDDYE